MRAYTFNRSNDDHMISNYAKNGAEIQYCLSAVMDCHIDENRTQALSHEVREMEASTSNRLTATTWLAILPKIASKSITI